MEYKEEDRLSINEILTLFQVKPNSNNVGDIFDTFDIPNNISDHIMFEEDDPIVVKKGRMHSSYEETTLHLQDDYFTPPRSNSLPITNSLQIKQKQNILPNQGQSKSLDIITNSFAVLLSYVKKK